MADKTLKALVNTVIKALPQDSSTLTDSQKFPLAKGDTLAIKQYRSAPNNHWEIQLETPRDGMTTWFAFISHVEIFVDQNFKQNLVNIATQEWEFFKKGTRKEREDGFWQRIVTYWKEALNRNDIDTRFDVGNVPWSAAFISWIMTKAGAADKFKRDASHSVYIRDSVKKRKDQVINAPFVAFKIDEVTPEIGDLVCAPRQSGVTYDTTDNYISHCDLVVAKRTNEIDIIGGNVSDSVTQKTLKLDTNGKVKDSTRPWFVVIKNLL
ncbi:MAG: DUF2272 domain-containing protein [Microcystis aeruginosa Ma_MB_F_20061100_S20]|uniref:DUF2272 domain-containing protein n=1 Tax=Microcystis aeruginosa Ma_MB_F_20061100_S20D TaxID=2486253 RepID=A0A552EW61_MICAE|nr:MAG: DUF2272 domain-containing protein [Microcystis aeruginosa Ma_MB_F_20061100_S20]TRU38713.1 MAG: DUF2272 domain-containing protein [Microcystis aeruginosa Ma_MB_F_20061100_S20D]